MAVDIGRKYSFGCFSADAVNPQGHLQAVSDVHFLKNGTQVRLDGSF